MLSRVKVPMHDASESNRPPSVGTINAEPCEWNPPFWFGTVGLDAFKSARLGFTVGVARTHRSDGLVRRCGVGHRAHDGTDFDECLPAFFLVATIVVDREPHRRVEIRGP